MISPKIAVSVIANNIKPYHTASATGASGPGDYSKWSFTLSSNYTDIIEGRNRITAKLSCPESTKWYSVNAIGVRTGQASAIRIPVLTLHLLYSVPQMRQER